MPNPAFDPFAAEDDRDAGAGSGSPDGAGESVTRTEEPLPLDGPADTAAGVLAQSQLVAYWPFDEGADDVTYDLGPSQMRTLLQGAAWTANTPHVSFLNPAALQFDGTSATAETADARLETLARPFTVCLWFRPDRGATGSRELLMTLSEPAKNLSFHLGRYRDGRLAV